MSFASTQPLPAHQRGTRGVWAWVCAVVVALAGCQPVAEPIRANFFDPNLSDATTRATFGILDKQPWPDSESAPPNDIRHSLALNEVIVRPGQPPLRVMVVASRPVGHDCHACRSQISLFAWSLPDRDGQTKLLAQAVFVEDMGAWGEAPQATLKRLPEGAFQIQLRDAFMAQGVEDTLELSYKVSHDIFVEVWRYESYLDFND